MATDTRERILVAGIACFAEDGFSGTTTRKVASAAGVNVATLAYHFGGKAGLYLAAIDHLYEQLRDVQPDLAAAGGTPAERVETLLRLAFRFARAHQTKIRLLLRHVLEQGSLPSRVRDEWISELLERVEGMWVGLGLPPDPAWKLKLLTLNHLVSRYAISEPPDLAPFVAGSEPHAAIEDHLVEVALGLFVL